MRRNQRKLQQLLWGISVVCLILLVWNFVHFPAASDVDDEEQNGAVAGRLELGYPFDPELAYVCLCANVRAVYPTLVLFQQLRSIHATRGQYVVLLASDIPPAIHGLFQLWNITIAAYPAHPSLFKPGYAVQAQSTRDRDRILWQKLWVWNLTAYRRVIMLDGDLLLRRNFDELFDVELPPSGGIAGVPMIYSGEKIVFWESIPQIHNLTGEYPKAGEPRLGFTGLNSGVLLLQPSAETFADLVRVAASLTQRPCCPTQEFLYHYFEARGAYHRLPPVYNLRKIQMLPQEEQRTLKRATKIYHFVEKRKPLIKGKAECQAEGDLWGEQWWVHAERVDAKLRKWAAQQQEADEEATRSRQELVRRIHLESIRSALK
jgi:hypothetical protein